jgi:hypothetical protein
MLRAIEKGSRGFAVRVRIVDVDREPALARDYGGEVPVLWFNGRKYAKYRLSAPKLRLKLLREAFRIESLS